MKSDIKNRGLLIVSAILSLPFVACNDGGGSQNFDASANDNSRSIFIDPYDQPEKANKVFRVRALHSYWASLCEWDEDLECYLKKEIEFAETGMITTLRSFSDRRCRRETSEAQILVNLKPVQVDDYQYLIKKKLFENTTDYLLRPENRHDVEEANEDEFCKINDWKLDELRSIKYTFCMQQAISNAPQRILYTLEDEGDALSEQTCEIAGAELAHCEEMFYYKTDKRGGEISSRARRPAATRR